MWKTAILGSFVGVIGWVVAQRVRDDAGAHEPPTEIGARTNRSGVAPTPAKLLYLEAYRRRNRQNRRPPEASEGTDTAALQVARANVDLRMRDIMGEHPNAA